MFEIRRGAALASLLVLLGACADAPTAPPASASNGKPAPAAIPADAAPLGMLPDDVKPTHYTLVVQIEPNEERFSGTTEIAIELAKPRSVIWMHAQNLTTKAASVRANGKIIPATLEQVHPTGLARLTLAEPLGPGNAVIRIDYSAPYPEAHLQQGLYKVKAGGKSYAVTQLEALGARRLFPSFDQPSFKTPFDVTLFVPKGDQAIANTKMIEHVGATDKLDRMTFATTKPLPTYLVAFAVGPWEIVDGPAIAPNVDRKTPLALRSVAADGRGKELGFTNAHTGEILTALERYAGIGYPYDKLDIIAVPEKGGAMENPGAVTFRESLVLLDEKPSVDVVENFYDVMSHELAHQWFGDLVTAKWWDDIWLNESFATWMSYKIVGELRPDFAQEVEQVSDAHRIMNLDALASARQIRQAIHDNNDVANAFDGITYIKGAAVLTMFERWLGKPMFQKGLQRYLGDHRFQAATVDDLMTALTQTAGRDVGTPFRTFLDQPGVPLVKANLVCGADKPKLHLAQSRFLLPGSTADANKTWQIPVCAKFPDGGAVKEACTLLTEHEGDLELPVAGCPAWVMPNADGAGYYRFELPAAQASALAKKGAAKLGVRDKMAFSDSVTSGYARGAVPFAEAMELVAPFANEGARQLAVDPGVLASSVVGWLWNDPKLVASARHYLATLYAPSAKRLGWEAKAGANESSGDKRLREGVLMTMAEHANDPATRAEAAKRGRAYIGFGGDSKLHVEAVAPDLAGLALAIAAEDGDAKFFDALVAFLDKTDDENVRVRILRAIGHARAPELAERARKLTLEPRLKANEWIVALDAQFDQPELRESAWSFVKANVEALVKKRARRARQITLANVFCDEARAREVDDTFKGHLANFEGGPRELASTVERIRLCANNRVAQEKSARAFFATHR